MNTTITAARSVFAKSLMVTASVFAISSLVAANVHAQSATRTTPSASPSAAPAGSSTVGNATTVGLQGYCPVCVIEMKKWMKGNQPFAAQHDGKTYLFPGAQQQQMFEMNPAKYEVAK